MAKAIMPDFCKAIDTSGEVRSVEGILSRETLRESASPPTARRVSLKDTEQPAWDMIPISIHIQVRLPTFPVTIVEGNGVVHNSCSFLFVSCIV